MLRTSAISVFPLAGGDAASESRRGARRVRPCVSRQTLPAPGIQPNPARTLEFVH